MGGNCHRIVPCLGAGSRKQFAMPPLSPEKKGKRGPRKGAPGDAKSRNWNSFFKNTIVLVLVISLAVHLLFLLAFGSVAIFKGSVPKLPFLSQDIAPEVAAESTPAPPDCIS